MLERVWREGNPPPLLVGMETGEATIKNNMEVPLRSKNRASIWSCNPTPERISKENHNLKTYMYPNVHSSTIYNSQDMEVT